MRSAWSPARVAAAVVLAAWAGLFWFLDLTQRWTLYLSGRTSWLVPAGAILLTIAAVGRLATARTDRAEPLRRRETWVLGAIVLPVVLVLALPPATLGTFGLGKRAGFVGAGVSVSGSDIASGALTFIDIAAAQTTHEGQAAIRRRAGEQIDLEGFVWREDGAPADEILLTRYVITCCVADATSAQVRVVNVPPGRFAADDWVRVTGRVYPLGNEILVDASDVEAIPQPAHPYLTA
jgi:uncharacterized repeat protein (TIGR03943 family)